MADWHRLQRLWDVDEDSLELAVVCVEGGLPHTQVYFRHQGLGKDDDSVSVVPLLALVDGEITTSFLRQGRHHEGVKYSTVELLSVEVLVFADGDMSSLWRSSSVFGEVLLEIKRCRRA
jgi:hypothetical protein